MPKVTVHKCAETIQGQKLYEEIRYIVATKTALKTKLRNRGQKITMYLRMAYQG